MIDPMTKTFLDALLNALAQRGVSLKAVAEGAGVSYEQLKKVRQRPDASTNVDDALKVANHFGLTLDEFLGDELASDRAAAVSLYSQLTENERRILRAAARDRDAPSRPEGQ